MTIFQIYANHFFLCLLHFYNNQKFFQFGAVTQNVFSQVFADVAFHMVDSFLDAF